MITEIKEGKEKSLNKIHKIIEIYLTQLQFYKKKKNKYLCNPKLKIYQTRCLGSEQDQTMLNFSQIKSRFENGEFEKRIVHGDGGYECNDYIFNNALMRNPRVHRLYLMTSTRAKIKNAFGFWNMKVKISRTSN